MDILSSRIYRVADVLISLFLLNLLWLVTCLPLITIGPATAAMFGVVRGWINNADSEVVMPFIRHLKANFARSLLIGFLGLVVCCVLLLDLVLTSDMGTWWKGPVFLLAILATLCFAITSVYLFPVMVNYEGPWQSVIRNSFLIAIVQPSTTLQCILLVAFALVLVYLVPALVLLAGSGTAYILYLLCRRAFNRVEELKGMKSEG